MTVSTNCKNVQSQNILFEVVNCQLIPNWTNDRIAIVCEYNITFSVNCTHQIGKLK